MRIALVAEESAGLQAMRRIVRSGHDLVMVLTEDVRRRSPGSGIIEAAAAAGAPVETPIRVRDPAFADALRDRGVDALLNVHSLFPVDAAVLEAPAVGAFNLHPAILPEYAGLNAVSWALYEGAKVFGSTLHWMAPTIDAGPIAYAASFDIDDDMTAGRLMNRAVQAGLGLLDRLLSQLMTNAKDIPRIAQDLGRRRYFGRKPPHDGRIDWSAHTASEIGRFVRACDYDPFESPWGRARARVGRHDVEITRAIPSTPVKGVVPGSLRVDGDGTVFVAARDAWVELRRIRIGGRPLSVADVARFVGAGGS